MRNALVLLATIVFGFIASDSLADQREVRLATSTTVQESGLIGELLPEFTKETGVKVRVVAASPAAALVLASEGAADVVLADAPEAEDKLLASRVLLDRQPLLQDWFLIAGPANDPAKVREATSGSDAFRRLAAAKAPYLSLGHDTAAHVREHELMKAAGLDPAHAWPGYTHGSATPVETVRLAAEQHAYTLTDVWPFMTATRAGAKLERLTKADDDLGNVYALLRVNPEKFPGKIDHAGAKTLVEWLLRPSSARKIAEYGIAKWGQPYFRPLNVGEE